MIQWKELKDGAERFFVAESTRSIEPFELPVLLNELLDGWCENVLRGTELEPHTTLFFEVNCDTGRIIFASGTTAMRANGELEGCAVRAQALQDFWYDLDESDASESEFDSQVQEKVRQLSECMLAQIKEGRCGPIARARDVAFVAFGSEKDIEVLRTSI